MSGHHHHHASGGQSSRNTPEERQRNMREVKNTNFHILLVILVLGLIVLAGAGYSHS